MVSTVSSSTSIGRSRALGWRAAIAGAAVGVLLAATAPAAATVWPSSHQRVAEALESGDVSERRRAASRLAILPPAMAKTLALKAVRDGDAEVRIYGARAAAALGVEKAGDEVVSWLQERDARLRIAACELIEASPTPASVQALARVLGDAQPEVRKSAAAAMGGAGLADAVGPLLGHLDDGSEAVRLEVVRALGRIGDDRAVVPLVSKLQDQEEAVRREAARALGRLGDDRAAATLMLALQDKALSVRVQALDALGHLHAEEATAAIAALLSNDDRAGSGTVRGPVRDAALRALGRIGNAQAITLLVRALEAEGPTPLDAPRPSPVRQALALAGDPAVDALLDALEASPSKRLASAAVLALATLGAERAIPAIVRASRRGAVELDAGLRALGELGDPKALPFVLEHVEDPDARVRQAVVAVATELSSPERQDGRAVDVVRDRVLDLTASLGERAALVRLLGRTGSPRALELLLSLASSGPVALRVAVLEAIGELGVSSKAVDATLLEALGDPSARLRMAAATALGRVGRDEAADVLLHRLGVSAEQDRAAIGIALAAVLGHSTQPALVAGVASALQAASGQSRDALIEGLGRMGTDEALAQLGALQKSPSSDDRRKVAEALGSATSSQASERSLLAMAKDPDPTVRANVAWSLGNVGTRSAEPTLVALVGDLDVAVAGNAVAALGRIARASGAAPANVGKAICGALDDYRSYVRAAALYALRIAPVRCPLAKARRLLQHDRSWRVRLGAATLLAARLDVGASAQPAPSAGAPAGQTRAAGRAPAAGVLTPEERSLSSRALWRCSVEDRHATVAKRCSELPARVSGKDDVLVYVVPDGRAEPVARAPFALVLADGAMRLGVADRRGAVFEAAAPAGVLELAVPAALAP